MLTILTWMFAQKLGDIVDLAINDDPGIFVSVVLGDFFLSVGLHYG